MMKFIVEQLQTVLMGVAIIGTGLAALRGFYRANDESGEPVTRYDRKRATRAISVGLVAILATSAVAFTPRGYSGVVFSQVQEGVLDEELGEGAHFVWPIIEHVTNVNTQIQVYRHNDEAVFQHTLDTQEIRVPIAVNYSVDKNMASYVYRELSNGPATIIEPAVLRALRSTIGQYSLEDISKNQALINTQIEDAIRPQLELHGLNIVYVAIEDTIAKPGIIEAIEAERIAERNKLTATHNREIAVTNAESAVATATGQAESIRVVALAEEDRQNRLTIDYIMSNLWNGAVPQIILGDDAGTILPLPELTTPTTIEDTEDE